MTGVLLDKAPIAVDPIGAAGAWMLTPIVSAIALGYAVLQSTMHRSEIVHPELMVVAVCVLACSGLVLSVAAHPSFARLSAAAAACIVGGSVLAAVLSELAIWGHNRLVQDDWGQIGVGLIVLGLLWLRPPREALALGVVGAIVVGVMAASQRGTLHITNTPYVYAVVAAMPVLLLTAVTVTSGAVIVRTSSDWLLSARSSLAGLEPELRMLERDSLHRAQLAELRHATLPLLASIAERGEITPSDIEAAARVSAQLRERAVGELRVTWLDDLLAATGMPPHAARDLDRLAAHVPERERAAVTACLIELVRIRAIDPSSASIAVVRAPSADDSERSRFEVQARLAADWRSVRRTARPFVSVLRSLSGDAAISRNDTTMKMRFGFVPA
ncbi:hypothetical protein [Humibacter ginsenosidimutans]|uniref:Uncharacterized protein n=1 Tax=Humibacter ginsenosidimutans TaxID=2599293 RepID=A0A5B8M9I7_9MICO|nr:hypothetical protein [Humibacter ginsenosidimutans]QDZ16335.1 hypothetical protein FPZ11_17655 [Humibacter ginsenosidimutans]